METYTLIQCATDEAARVMRAAGLTGATRTVTAEELAAKGIPFRLTTTGGTGVFVVSKCDAQLWVHGAGAVGSKGLTADGLEVIEKIARHAGCTSVGFRTVRRGLVRLACRRGYVAKPAESGAFILEKH